MMQPRTYAVAAWGMLFVALAAWGGVVYLYTSLGAMRFEYADRVILAEQDASRQESSARLRALIQGTEVERATLESIVGVRIVDAAEIVEIAVRDAGAQDVEITEANAAAPNSQGISTVSMGVSAAGSFASVLRAVRLLETISIPSTVEHFELVQNEDGWRMVARLRLTLANIQ